MFKKILLTIIIIGAKGTTWIGVTNCQATNNLKQMKKVIFVFFYHSNIKKIIYEFKK